MKNPEMIIARKIRKQISFQKGLAAIIIILINFIFFCSTHPQEFPWNHEPFVS